MAEIVLGIGTSHGPLLSTPPEKWDLRAQADRVNKQHHFRGRSYDYESLLKERAPGFANEMTIEARRDRHARCQRALDAVGRKFKDVAPEAFVIVGNDQREIFSNDLTPAITVFRGQEIENILERNNVGRLAFSLHDRVDIQPIHYVYERGWLYGRTSEGDKIATLAMDMYAGCFAPTAAPGRVDRRSGSAEPRIVRLSHASVPENRGR